MNLMGYLNMTTWPAPPRDQLAERCRDRDPGSELGLVLKALVPEIEQDREVLERVVRALGGSPPRIKQPPRSAPSGSEACGCGCR